jgi:hypothetical protein
VLGIVEEIPTKSGRQSFCFSQKDWIVKPDNFREHPKNLQHKFLVFTLPFLKKKCSGS